eukprot:jgi/Botrbrau1/20887/Bobra.0135s0018.1
MNPCLRSVHSGLPCLNVRQRRVDFKRSATCVAAPPEREVLVKQNGQTANVRVAVLGASGYTGEEVIRLLALHPSFQVTALTGESQAGKAFSDVYPHLITATDVPNLVKIADVDFQEVDAAFCCLPHATTQEILSSLPRHVKVVDLSADFRLRDVDVYAKWYGLPHKAPELQKEAVYGLTELHRDKVAGARLVANPGCYPTSVQLPLCPLIQDGLVTTEDILVDAKSGVSGAGRSAQAKSAVHGNCGGHQRIWGRQPPSHARDRAGLVRRSREGRQDQLHAPPHANVPRNAVHNLRAARSRRDRRRPAGCLAIQVQGRDLCPRASCGTDPTHTTCAGIEPQRHLGLPRCSPQPGHHLVSNRQPSEGRIGTGNSEPELDDGPPGRDRSPAAAHVPIAVPLSWLLLSKSIHVTVWSRA